MNAPDPAAAASRSPESTPVSTSRAALAWAHSARFLVTASRLEQLPPPGLPEIAFVGRSNAGKSSAINALAQHRRLAFSSRTPGRTQHINLFEVGPRERPDALFADLPGYGYAAVERQAKLRWQRVMADYLAQREALAGVVLLADVRLGLTALDEKLLALVAPRVAGGAVRLLVLLTKADKLNRRDAAQALARAEAALAGLATDEADIGVTLFSALKGQGVSDVAQVLYGWRATAEQPASRMWPAREASPGAGREVGRDVGHEVQQEVAP